MHPITRLSPAWLPPPAGGAFAHTVSFDVAGVRLVETAGLMALDEHGHIVAPGDMAAQSEHVFSSLARLLGEQSATFGDVVRITAFLTDMRHVRDYGAVLRRYVTESPPASVTVQVARLYHPDAVVEVAASAALPIGRPAA